MQCPWDYLSETRIVYGRDNAGYIFNGNFLYFQTKNLTNFNKLTLKI